MEKECKIHGLTEYVLRQDGGGHRCKNVLLMLFKEDGKK